ncbi:MAG: hypothetical protein HW380_3792 [Magnetococcales bacterium]|nr:hypothetical protein [Magnetococcales bacterium]
MIQACVRAWWVFLVHVSEKQSLAKINETKKVNISHVFDQEEPIRLFIKAGLESLC